MIVGPHHRLPLPVELSGRLVVRADPDVSSELLGCVGVDHRAVANIAANHLLSKGLEHFATFSFEEEGWAIARVEGVRQRIAEQGGECHADGWLDAAASQSRPRVETGIIPGMAACTAETMRRLRVLRYVGASRRVLLPRDGAQNSGRHRARRRRRRPSRMQAHGSCAFERRDSLARDGPSGGPARTPGFGGISLWNPR